MLSLLFAIALAPGAPTEINLNVGGVDRKAIVYRSSSPEKPSPVVFVFHGFTGTNKHAAFAYQVHTAWPEATVIYPQGLEVKLLGRTGPGWQIGPNMQDGRDIKFFDAMMAKVRSDFKPDLKRVFTCGMSNGAIFSYLLLAERGATFAAAAPVAGFAPMNFRSAPATPILITHGKNDPLLPFSQAERSRDVAIQNNKSGKIEKEWMPGYTQYTPVVKGNDVVWHTHEGGHEWPAGTTDAIVKFFKAHSQGG